jgi:hypothetical protein
MPQNPDAPSAPTREELAADAEWLPAPEETILRMRQEVLSGTHWFVALLDAIGRWRLPQETVRGREYRYLTGGEAFDWLLLAERLLEEMPDLVPAADQERLLFQGRWPIDVSDEEFARRLGSAKHSAHLNHQYGVLVEEALQLFVEEEIHKEIRARAWGQDQRVDETMFERVYMKSRMELVAQRYEETGQLLADRVDYGEWKEFVYWLFKLRLRRQDKARVASDTRKGLAQLSRMELAVNERRHGGRLAEADFEARYVHDTGPAA